MNWRQFFSISLITCGVLVTLMAIYAVGPNIETRFWPVYSKFRLVSVEPYGENQSRAIFEFTKLRQCEPQGASWFAGELGAAFHQLPVRIEGQQGASRPLGLQISKPYIIDAPPHLVEEGVFAEVYSRCFPFWTTRSQVYP